MGAQLNFDAKTLRQIAKGLNDISKVSVVDWFVSGAKGTGPNPGGQQRAFESDKHELFVMGGNRSGKTYCNVMKGALFMIPEKEKAEGGRLKPTGWAINPYQRRRIPPDGMLGWWSTYSNEVQKSALQLLVDKILKPYWIGDPLKENGAYQQIKTEAGMIQFKWQTAGKSTYESADCDWVGCDEPHDPVIYNEAKSRIKFSGGYIWTTATLVQNADDPEFWKRQRMITWLVDSVLKPLEDDPEDFAMKFPETDVVYIHADENRFFTTSKEVRDALNATMSEEERYVRETGRVMNVSAYSLFSVDMLDALKGYIDKNAIIPEYGEIIFDPQESNGEYLFTFEGNDLRHFGNNPKSGWALKIWEHPIVSQLGVCPGYVISADCAEGRKGGDYTCAYVSKLDTGQIVASIHGYIDENDMAVELWKLGWYYKDANNQPAMIGIEVNNAGTATLGNLLKGNPNIGLPVPYPRNRLYRRPKVGDIARGIHAPSDKYGWYTTASKSHRGLMLSSLREYFMRAYAGLANGEILIPDKGIIDEAKTFVKDDSGKYEAASGYKDDRIMSLAIAEMIRKQQNKRRKSEFIIEPTAENNGTYIYDHKEGKIYWNWDKVLDKAKPVSAFV